MTLHIEARRWFQKTYGNTYHSVRIYRDGRQIAHVPFDNGTYSVVDVQRKKDL